MRIINRGINLKYYPGNSIICNKCGCVFLVNNRKEINWEKEYKTLTNGVTYIVDRMRVKCPNSSCKNGIILSTDQVNYIIKELKMEY